MHELQVYARAPLRVLLTSAKASFFRADATDSRGRWHGRVGTAAPGFTMGIVFGVIGGK